MKRLNFVIIITLAVFLAVSCGSGGGETEGESQRSEMSEIGTDIDMDETEEREELKETEDSEETEETEKTEDAYESESMESTEIIDGDSGNNNLEEDNSKDEDVTETPDTEEESVWVLSPDTRIFWLKTEDSLKEDKNLAAQMQLFAGELAEKITTEELPVYYGEIEEAGNTDILLVLREELGIPCQGYHVAVHGKRIVISASDKDGLFYGCRYLIKQLLQKDRVAPRTDKPAVLERGLSLDIGRKYYSREWIEQLIKEMSWSNMNALILHFSEEMGLGLESKSYPWLAGRDGSLCTQAEIATDSRYLTQEELRRIAEVAKLYHVELIPSFDSPGHLNYIVKTYNAYYGKTDAYGIGNYFSYNGKTALVQGSRNKAYSRGIDISNPKAVAFIHSLIEEYALLFKELGATKFDIGGDELLGWGSAVTTKVPKWQQLDHWKAYAIQRTGNDTAVAYDGFLLYMNDLNDLVSGYGYTSVRMWNDDALRTFDTGYKGVVTLNGNIEIQYWDDKTNGGQNSVHTFLENGYCVYNCINTYNYYAMTENYYANPPLVFAGTNQREIYEEWNPYIFTSTNHSIDSSRCATVGDPRIKGSALCVWCDNPALKTSDEVMEDLIPLIRANGIKAWNPKANETLSYKEFIAP